MFIGVYEKLERAGYFLNNLKTLAEDAGGFPYIKKRQELRANLDAFFFEIISAKDFFLQGINDYYGLGLRKQEATDIAQLKRCIECKGESKASEVVVSIEKQLSNKDTWLWQLNNYRNSATHRELLHLGFEANITYEVDKASFDKIKQEMEQGKIVIKPIFEGQEKSIPPDVPRVDVPRENIKTYLFKDPEDSSQGNAAMEVIPYCEQSLEQMRKFLDGLHSQLGD